jgi:DNA end-binding protein Ku
LRKSREKPLDDLSKEALYQRAQNLDIPGRSKMSKKALIEAIQAAR